MTEKDRGCQRPRQTGRGGGCLRESLVQTSEVGDGRGVHHAHPDRRRTRYTINPDSLFRHSAQGNLRIGPFLVLLTATGDDPARSGNGDDPARSGPEAGPSPG